MSSRLSLKEIENYAGIRQRQGFNAVQTVVGIPPEVGPENKNAFSTGGAAWNLSGEINEDYLDECEQRVKILNDAGLLVIIYGAWGHQIDWIKPEGIIRFWDKLIERFEKYRVYFCICGESNLWAGRSHLLLPNKTTKDFLSAKLGSKILLGNRISTLLRKIHNKLLVAPFIYSAEKKRSSDWSAVLLHVSSKTKVPLLIHTTPQASSLEVVSNPELLAAITVQTSHSEASRNRLWQEPLALISNNPGKKFINLEPWYEGILNNFYLDDQIYSYWVSMLAGAFAYCYGAHGIWNCGDGEFLSQWGNQTFDEGMLLETPMLLGESHQLFIDSGAINYPNVTTKFEGGVLHHITRQDDSGRSVAFFTKSKFVPVSETNYQYFNPVTGNFIDGDLPPGPVIRLT